MRLSVGLDWSTICYSSHYCTPLEYMFFSRTKPGNLNFLKETSTFKANTNIALLLQKAIQKYQKLTDYRTKYCYMSLLFFLLTATCTSVAFLNSRVFSGHSFEHQKWSFMLYIVSFSALKMKMTFSKLSLPKYCCLHKKTYIIHVFNYYRTSLQISLFYKFFCTNLSQVALRWLYVDWFV